jgi:GNAT superfamily N-acetyltransferase
MHNNFTINTVSLAPSAGTGHAWLLKDGTAVIIRAAVPADATLLERFCQELSPRDVAALNSIADPKVSTEMFPVVGTRVQTLVASRRDRRGESEIIGGASLYKTLSPTEGTIVVVVATRCRNLGLGTQLLTHLLDVAHAHGIKVVRGEMQFDNDAMQRVFLKLGGTLHRNLEAETVTARLTLCPNAGRSTEYGRPALLERGNQ